MTETIIKNPPWWNKRSTLEKSLLIIVVLIILTAIILAIGIIFLIFKIPAPTCVTPGCMETATKILNRMNQSVDPCENFYEFACGNYKNIVEIPKAESNVHSLSTIGNEIKEQVRAVLEEPIKSSESNSLVLGKKFYGACMDESNIEKQGLVPIKKILKDLGGWPILEGDDWNGTDFEWKEFNYKLRSKGLHFGQLLSVSVDIDAKKPKSRVLYLSQASLNMPKELLDQDIDSIILQAYFQQMIDIAIIFGANETAVKDELMDAFLFQRNLSEISLSQIELRNKTALYNPMTIDELQKMHPFVPWLEYINNILSPVLQINSTEIIINQTPSFITKLEGLLRKTSSRTIVNHIFWTIVRSSTLALPKEVLDTDFKFLQAIAGTPKTNPRWKKCIESTKRYFDLVIGSLYVRKYFNNESKKKTLEIVDDIQATFTTILQSTEWIEKETRNHAIEKLKAIDKHIAYPDELLDDKKLDDYYKDLKVDENSYFESGLAMSLFWIDFSFKRLREPVNKTDWTEHGNAATSGAFYIQSENSISIPAGILQGSFFASNRPNYMNYGAIGFTIGHEITHGFDNEGRQFDKDGMVHNWWDQSTEEEFLKKAECIIDQYSNYHISEVNKNINGTLTEGENIADNGGIKEAYLAYERWLARNKNQQELQLPGLPYTPLQMFWISFASTWCSKDRPQHLEILLAKDEHAPYPNRIIGSVSNRPEFAKDFQCAENSKMNPKEKCQIW